MSACLDRSIGTKLHHYELGLLDGEERLEFEQHLLECDYCLAQIEKLQNVSDLMKSDPSIRKLIESIPESISTDPDQPESIKSYKKKIRYFSAIAVAAVILVVLVLKDWQIDIRPSQEALATENRIAILPFDNLVEKSDSNRMGEIASNLLITDLSESHYLNIVSSQRLNEILGLLNIESGSNLSSGKVLQIANETNAKWILTGSILQTAPNLIITTQLAKANTGDIWTSQRIEGNSDDDIFSVIDKLTIEIKNNLSLPSDALNEPDPAIADYTTNSPQAYWHFLKGVECYNKVYFSEAQNEFEIALKFDSTFAMAYYYLASIKDASLINKAVEYSEGASAINRLYIKVFEASFTNQIEYKEKLLNEFVEQYPFEKKALFYLASMKHSDGQFDLAIDYLNRALEIDPRMKMAYNLIAYSYNLNGDFDKALWAIDKYIELAPDEPNPLDTKAEIYAYNGMLNNAIESYRRALKVKPDFYASLKSLSLVYMFNKEYFKADSCLDLVISAEDSVYRDVARAYKCYIPLFQGKLDDAIGMIDNMISATDNNPYNLHFIKSQIHIERKEWTLALREIEKTIECHDLAWPEDKVGYRYFQIHILAQSGDIDKAVKLCQEFKEYFEKSGKSSHSYWYAMSEIAMAQGDYEKAINCLQKNQESTNQFFTNYKFAKAYFGAGKYNQSIKALEKLCNLFSINRAEYSIWSTKLYYLLGLSYEAVGRYDEAIEQYSVFLNIWKNADDGIDEIDDAKDRLSKLKSGA